MRRSQTTRAFTLIELLTVVAIIALLIAILVPTVQRAQRQAKEVAIKAQHHGVVQGLEMFKGDFGYYPSSLPQDADGVNITADRTVTTNALVQGAHRMVFALLGRDKLGCPAKKGERAGTSSGLPDANTDPSVDSLTGWYYSANPDGTFTDADGNKPEWKGPADAEWGNFDNKTARKGPYINPEGFIVVKDTSVDSDGVWVLCDKYDRRKGEDITDPTKKDYQDHSIILYYAASERAKGIDMENAGYTARDNIYFYEDNQIITEAGTGQFRDVNGDNDFKDDFWNFIEDKEAGIGNVRRPHNPESFILISRGWDGLYGSDDDIVNWSD